MNDSNWIQVGIVGKPYGLRGAFYVSGRDEPLFDQIEQVIIAKKPQQSKITNVTSQKIHKKRSVLIVESVSDRSVLEGLVGSPIWVCKDELPLEEEDEYFWEEIIGKNILNPKGEVVGEVIELSNHGASDVITVKNKNGATLELAFISDYFDMSFKRDDKEIQLLADSENFADLWQEPRKI